MTGTIPNPWPWYQPVISPPALAPLDIIPLCRGLHLQGSSFLTHWIEDEILRTRCPYCGATWELNMKWMKPQP